MLDISSDQKNQNSAYIINLSGSIDSETSRDFESFFSEMISQGYRFFILESSRLKSMSNSGIAGLVQFLKKIENESGFVCFAALNYENHMLMDFCGISQKYPVFATLIEAENFIQQVMSDSAKDKTISNPVQPEIRDLYGNHGFSRGYNRKKDLHKETLQEFS
ncbi:MAG: STAS domain-containing protein, partial [Spirochaetia bacterium]|nr:STAS domain-containing protein [Spirochaetia bacterium]